MSDRVRGSVRKGVVQEANKSPALSGEGGFQETQETPLTRWLGT